jgi:hypothetical protein
MMWGHWRLRLYTTEHKSNIIEVCSYCDNHIKSFQTSTNSLGLYWSVHHNRPDCHQPLPKVHHNRPDCHQPLPNISDNLLKVTINANSFNQAPKIIWF